MESCATIMGRLRGHSRKDLIRLHHRKQHFSIGKDVLLLLAVSKTGCGVEGRRHEKKRAGVAASIEQSPIKSTRKRAAKLGIPRTHEKRSEGIFYGQIMHLWKIIMTYCEQKTYKIIRNHSIYNIMHNYTSLKRKNEKRQPY
ncbi:hypothetical protein C0J52_07622 [Blattella germanica]|nr:hypothetical protein C0J52_07622 [Blattella germanica]